MPVIYIDVLFLINFIIDTILLMIAGALSGKDFSFLKLIAGGLLGGIYGICVFFAPLSFVDAWLIKFAVSAVMVGIPFGFKPFRDFLRIILNFYISFFLLGGALSAIFFLSGRPAIMANGIYYFPLSLFQLILIAVPSGFLLAFYYIKSKNCLLSHGKYCTVTIELCGKIITAPGLIDTGCSLLDPYVHKPAIIIDPEMAKTFEHTAEMPIRLIPFSTIESSGFMKAFSPDSCTITSGDKTYSCNCSVAISPTNSGGKIIINPDIIKSFGGK